MPNVVTVASNGKNITIQPTRIWFERGKGNQEIRWNVAGSNDVQITEIAFDPQQNPPITDIQKIPGTNDWIGTNNTDVEGFFKYTIALEVNGKPLHPLDPEVENGPPGGEEIGDGG